MALNMTKSDALEIVREYLRSTEGEGGGEMVVLEEHTIERDFGWVFFYDSKRHLETGDIRDAIAGNAPIVVTKVDGRLHETGTAYPVEHYLKKFER